MPGLDESAGGRLLTSLIVVALAIIAYQLLSRWGRRAVERLARAKGGPEAAARAHSLWSVGKRLLGITIGLAALMVVLAVWDINGTGLLAIGGAIGVAVGLGAQDLVKDVFSGFVLLAEGQYNVGDVLQVGNVEGEVVDLQPRVTVLRDADGTLHYVPNGEIRIASNRTRGPAVVSIDLPVRLSADVAGASAAIGDELDLMAVDPAWTGSFLSPARMLGVQEIRGSALVLRAQIEVAGPLRHAARREALRRVKDRLDREGIPLAVPEVKLAGEPSGESDSLGP